MYSIVGTFRPLLLCPKDVSMLMDRYLRMHHRETELNLEGTLVLRDIRKGDEERRNTVLG